MKRSHVHTSKKAWIFAAVLLLASACSAADDSDVSEADAEEEVVAVAETEPAETDASASESEEVVETEESDDEADSETEAAELVEPDLTGLRPITFPALGGLRLATPPDVQVLVEGELFQIRQPDGDGQVVVARVSHAITGAEVTTIDEFVEVVSTAAGPDTEVTATDQTLSVLGLELEMFEVRNANGNLGVLFGSRLVGQGSNAGWSPAPHADVYLAEAEGGVLAIAALAQDPSDLPEVHTMLEDVAATMWLTSEDGMRPVPADLPPFVEVFGEVISVEPREADNGLVEIFTPIESGNYDLVNLAQPTLIDVPDAWFVAPNFPGFIVLADLTVGMGAGPGDHDVAFLPGITTLTTHGYAMEEAAPSVSVQTREEINAMLDSPPSTWQLTNVDREATLGGQPAIRFDLTVDSETTCQAGSPCSFALTTADPQSGLFLKSGYAIRVWMLPELDGLAISTMAPAANADWLDGRALEVVESLSFEP